MQPRLPNTKRFSTSKAGPRPPVPSSHSHSILRNSWQPLPLDRDMVGKGGARHRQEHMPCISRKGSGRTLEAVGSPEYHSRAPIHRRDVICPLPHHIIAVCNTLSVLIGVICISAIVRTVYVTHGPIVHMSRSSCLLSQTRRVLHLHNRRMHSG